MRNFIPVFIQRKTEQGDEKEGSFKSSTMFMDISGFTNMTEALMGRGKEGAEVLSVILNQIFEPIIDEVYRLGGFVSGFAGDAMTIIFPDEGDGDSSIRAIFAARFINSLFKRKGVQDTRLGTYELFVKLGLSYGNVNCGIVGSEDAKSYYFRGASIDGCAESEHHCEKMEIVIDNAFSSMFLENDLVVEHKGKEHYKVIRLNITAEPEPTTTYDLDDVNRNTIAKFVSKAAIDFDQVGEFRSIVSLFVSFQKTDSFSELNRFITSVLDKTYGHGGYFNSLDFGDKGGNLLILFGAPISHEDNVSRAVRCVYSIKKEFPNMIRAGLLEGIAYTGIVGIDKRCTYTALGNTVNLSARFMMKANWGDIWLASNIANKIKGIFQTEDLGKHPFKGVKEDVQVYKLLKEKKQELRTFEGEMVGRDEELNKLKELSKPLYDGKFASIVYIYGDAGTGKSRLVYEISKELRGDVNEFMLQSDNILKKSLNPFVYSFEKYFQQEDLTDKSKKREAFDKVYDRFMEQFKSLPDSKAKDELIEEIERIRSIIASVIDIYWDGSVYSTLDKKDIPEVTAFAIKSFFKAQSLIKPVLMLFEDIHWIDDGSKEAVQLLTRELDYYPIMIVAVSRFNDDGTKPIFNVDDNIKTDEINITNLSKEAAHRLIRNVLGKHVGLGVFELICEKTSRNPFFIEQVCIYLEENNLLREQNTIYELRDNNVEIPMEINTILVARIDRLSAELKEAVQVSSILGREFDVKIIYEMLEVLTHIINLLEKEEKENVHLISTRLKAEQIRGILSEGKTEKVWTNLTEIKYIFKHALLMDVVYGMQLKQRLRALHRLAGEAITNLYIKDKSRYPDIAYHYDKADHLEEANKYYRKSGEYALEQFKNEKALEYYSRALDIAKELYGEDDLEIASLYTDLGEVYINMRDFEQAQYYNQEALNIRLDKLGENHEESSENYNYLGFCHLKQSEHEEARDIFQKVLDIRKKVSGENSEGVAEAYINIGTTYLEEGHYDQAKENYEKALSINKKIHGEEHSETALTYSDISMIHWMKGENDTAIDYLKKAENILLKVVGEDHLFLGIIYTNYGKVYWSKGDAEKSIDYSKKALQIRENILGKNHLDTVFPYNNIGMVYWTLGEYEKAFEYLNKTLEILFEVMGRNHIHTAIVYGNVAMLLDTLGDYDKAMENLNKSYAIFKSQLGEEHPFIALAHSNMGRVYASKEEFDKAIDHLKRAVMMRKAFEDKNSIGYDYTFLSYVYAMTGNYEESLQNALAHLKNIDEIGNDVEKGRTHLSIAVSLAKNSTSNGAIDDLIKDIQSVTEMDNTPETYFEKALQISSGYPPTQVPVLYRYAEYLFDKGETDKAKDKVTQAKELARKNKLEGELRKIEKIKPEMV
jgi:tetratricopeptide (TPR) repeat protein/class 3 adenylate cyclase